MVKNQSGEHPGSKILNLSKLDYAGLYTKSLKELPILIRVASKFVKSPANLALSHVPTFYVSAKTLLDVLSAIFANYRTNSRAEVIRF